ncbi:MAG: hypothetical protein WAM68_05200 [Acidobacteriaceae bacterium]
MSQLPASTVRTLRPQVVRSSPRRASSEVGSALPGPVPVPPPAPAPPPNKTHDLDVIGPRKLIRPTLPDSVRRNRRYQRQDEPTLIVGSAIARVLPVQESSHAESFYLQKQVQAQTPMVFILDDGEKIEGSIEWYDRNVIKVRCTASPFRNIRLGDTAMRALIYKSSIKYLYKAGENQPS